MTTKDNNEHDIKKSKDEVIKNNNIKLKTKDELDTEFKELVNKLKTTLKKYR
jgi:hypothetical protein